MVSFAAALIMCCSLFFISRTNGELYRTPCPTSSQLRCDNGYCINKHQWCDGSRDCSDRSDESFCGSPWGISRCNASLHFECKSYAWCIPMEGYCDGYSSCPDQSDEENCPCEEINNEEGHIDYIAFIGDFQTFQKCWKFILREDEYLELTMKVKMYNRDCNEGNVTLGSDTSDEYDFRFCRNSNQDSYDYRVYSSAYSRQATYSNMEERFILRNNVLIRYRSNFYSDDGEDAKDFIQMKYHKVGELCNKTDVFKCSKYSCISPEEQCDGKEDCQNGSDEENCEYHVLSEAYLKNNRIKAVQWMRNQHNTDWGWKENTHRAVIALYLSEGAYYNGSNKDYELFAKQLELETSTYLLRRNVDKISPTEISAFINALLVICHDPRNFYGYDLISVLKEELEELRDYAPPFAYLALCNAKEPISQDAVEMLLEILQSTSSGHGFDLEIQALATMVLSCITSNEISYSYLQQNMSDVLRNLKMEQLEDGSFGNEYTTALVLQALLATNQENSKDWSPKSAINFLLKKQEENGSFGDFLTTYLVLPLLNSKSLVDIGKINCTEDLKRPREGHVISDIRNRLGGKVLVKYSLYIGDEKDQVHPILLRTAENISLFELMTLAADIDPKYKFKTHEVKKKMYVYEISNVANDPEYNKFWFIYQASNGTAPALFSEQSPDRIRMEKNDHVILWYKSLRKM